jgi:hypothetical protein
MKNETVTQVVPTTPAAAEVPAKLTQEQITARANELIKKHGGTKSAAIRALDAEKKTRGEIAKLLDIRYQHVRNILITPIKKQMVK